MPDTRTIRGKIYVPCVLKVVEKDSAGPRLFSLVRQDESVKLEGGEDFWIVWAPEEMMQRYN
jgi:hypothetical protein